MLRTPLYVDYVTSLGGVKRLLSLGLRMLAKLPIHYILPWLAARWGTPPDPERSTTGLMVAVTRRAHGG
jgi:hypothetical protein